MFNMPRQQPVGKVLKPCLLATSMLHLETRLKVRIQIFSPTAQLLCQLHWRAIQNLKIQQVFVSAINKFWFWVSGFLNDIR